LSERQDDTGDVVEHGAPHPYVRRVSIGPHEKRTDSPEYVASRAKLASLDATVPGLLYGAGPYEDHHGGGLWLKDDQGWFLVRNLAGMEWSAQFCADPAKVDKLRLNARRLYAAFPDAVAELGIRDLLDTPITDAAAVARWTDSICNASVPLPRSFHTGELPLDAGVHYYPTPICDIQFIKQDSFPLWVSDGAGGRFLAVPHGVPGSGDGRLRILAHEAVTGVPADHHAEALAALPQALAPQDEATLRAAVGEDPESLVGTVLPADHPVARAAFARQNAMAAHRQDRP
jgi:hypothetical protein